MGFLTVILYSNRAQQEGLAVASIVQDDLPPLPGMHCDHSAPACTASPHALRLAVHAGSLSLQCAENLDRNLKPKLAIMRQCTSVTDEQTDGH